MSGPLLRDLWVEVPGWLAWLPRRFDQIVSTLEPGDAVAVVPGGTNAQLFVKALERRFGLRLRTHVLQDEPAADHAVLSIDRAAELEGVSHYFVVSTHQHAPLVAKLRAAGVQDAQIVNLGPDLFPPRAVSLQDAGQMLLAAGDETNVRVIHEYVGDHPLLVLYGPGLSDVLDKAAILQGAFGTRTLWIKTDASGPEQRVPTVRAETSLMTVNARDAFRYLSDRQGHDRVLLLSIHANGLYASVAMFRAFFPGLRIVAYVFDWLNLFCPYSSRDVFARYTGCDPRAIDSEYRAIEAMLSGEIVDGILHKDGGEHFPLLEHYSRPHLFFPPWPRRMLIQPPSRHPSRPRRILFMGAALSARVHTPDLFRHGILFGVLERVAARGFEIDLYLWKIGQDIMDEYVSYYRDHPRVRIREGAVLDQLVPRIAGKYDWGWLICDQGPGISDAHTRVTLASKLFTHLALGLPILATTGESCIADFVRSHGVGIVFDRADIDRLDELVDAADYEVLCNGVRRIQSQIALEQKQQILVRFVEEVVGDAWPVLTTEPL